MLEAGKDFTGQFYKACENLRCLKFMVQIVAVEKYFNLSYYWTSGINDPLH